MSGTVPDLLRRGFKFWIRGGVKLVVLQKNTHFERPSIHQRLITWLITWLITHYLIIINNIIHNHDYLAYRL